MPTASAICVEAFEKRYGDVRAVNGVSFSVHPGEVFGLLGPNGAGKTTTLEAIVGLRTPSAGQIKVLGHDPHLQREKVLPLIGVQPQEASLFPTLTVEETLSLFASLYSRARDVTKTIELVGLTSKRRAYIKDLSGGQRQRVLVAVALISDPQILFLGEPTSGLDPQARRQLWSVVEEQRNARRTVMLTTHYMDEAERLCDRIAIIDRGTIVALGTPTELIDRYVPERRVLFELPPHADPSPLNDLPAIAQLNTRATPAGTQVSLATRQMERTLRSLTEMADLMGGLRGLRIEAGTLEDVFLHLTGRPIREEGASA